MQRVTTNPATRSRAERFHEAAPLSAGAAPACGVPDEVVIGGVRIAPATILAPMAGVTDTVFRRFIKYASYSEAPHQAASTSGAPQQAAPPSLPAREGQRSPAAHPSFDPNIHEQSACGLIMTEFTSADGLYRCRESKRKRYLHFYEDEHPISAQLFGSDPAVLAGAAKIVEDCGFDLVDLNLGCPAKKVVKCNGGSGLLRDLPHIRTIFETVRAAVNIPFTVKFRMGWDDDQIVCVELAKLAEDCGLQAVALHARTREQGYSGNARWEWIAAVKDAVKIPVIGNGDIRTPEDAALMVEKTGCDAVMIGRTAPSNPWIFRQIAQYKKSLQATGVGTYDHPTETDRHAMMKTYFQMLVDEEVPAATGKMKQFAAWFTHGVPGGANLRKAVYQARDGEAILREVDTFFAQKLEGAVEPSPFESMTFADCG